MIQLKDNGKIRFYFDNYGLLLERGVGIGDSTWRLALMLIATGNKILLNTLKKQVHLVKGKYRYTRHPDDNDNDGSRDTSIVGHVALKLNNYEHYEKVRDNLSFRISKKFTWQEGYFWAKEKYGWWIFLSFYMCIGVFLVPAYSRFLLALMIWCSGKKRRVLIWLLLKKTPKWNYVVRILLNDKFSKEDIDAIKAYKPRIDFIWQRNFDPKKHRLMRDEESTANCLDKMFLDWAYENIQRSTPKPLIKTLNFWLVITSIIWVAFCFCYPKLTDYASSLDAFTAPIKWLFFCIAGLAGLFTAGSLNK